MCSAPATPPVVAVTAGTSSRRRRLRRIVVRAGAALLILTGVAAAVIFVFVRKFYPSPPAPSFPAPQSTIEAQLQDLRYLREYLVLDRSYTTDARAQAEALLHEAEDRVKRGALPAAELDLIVGRVAALANNGHSRMTPLSLADRHSRLPCRMYRFSDGFHIVRARASCAGALGAKVVAIDGRAVGEIVDGMYEYFGGPRQHYDQFAAVFFLESPQILHAAGFARSEDGVSLTVMDDGGTRDVRVEADPPDPSAPRSYSDEFLSPRRIAGEASDWNVVLRPDAALPLFLRDYDDPFQAQHLPEQNAYYVQLRSNQDEPGHPIRPFLARVSQEIERVAPRTIVLDLRLDQGGNLLTTASLMENLTKLSPSTARVIAITSAWTFSAGVFDLALLKEHGQAKVTILGQPAGDRARFWAEGGAMTLPNSKLRLTFATGLHDYSSPCAGQEGCFWPLRFYPMHVQSLDPDVPVDYAFADYVALRDPMLDAALALAKR